ncbi:hypothetical protein TYRP_012157 [Tyrophagus putrescentiae]|nr:hypothetical protein TYRP_012157 [Tyrophagus putrescentiae]
MSLSTRSPLLLALQALVLCTVLLLLTTGPLTPVEAGKKEKMLLGLAVGHAISNRAREHSLIRLIIPLRMAAEAWKHFGHATAHEHGGYEHYGHHHGHDHYGSHHHHLDHLHLDEHSFGGGHHLKA